ncbi:hypothetical protein [Streptomyces sp. NPDC051636]|uniref:hypothetical protein n=1 Tax=Streptomyces sp. NPDC051636 TaxID=3365663 RepID=UPI003799D18B
MEHEQTFPEQADVRYAVIGKGKRVHYSPSNDDGLCGRGITAYLSAEEAAALFAKGYELCAPCHRAAEKRAEARRLADASPLAAAAVALAETVEQGDAERAEAEQDVEQRYIVHELGDEYGVMDTYTVEWVIEQTDQSDAEATAERLNREHAEARAVGPIVHRFHSTREAYDATQTRDHIRDGDVLVIEREQVVGFLRSAWPTAITEARGELHGLTVPAHEYEQGRYAASAARAAQLAAEHGFVVAKLHEQPATPAVESATVPGALVDPWTWIRRPASSDDTRRVVPAAEQRIVEGVVVEHAGVTEGSTPSNSTHPDVVAARAALAQLKPAALTDHHDVTEPTEAEVEVRGFMLDPRGGGRVAAYWLEGGRIVRHDDPWHGPCLDILAMRFERAGWTVEPMLRSSQCVFAHRPAEDEVEQPAAPVSAALEKNTRAANVDLAGVDFGEPRCLHEVYPADGVNGDPITACARKPAGGRFGVWSDEGCVDGFDCAVEAANECARLNGEAEAPAGDPLYSWGPMCPEHDEQGLDDCETCNAVPAEDRCPECSGKGCHWCHWTGEKQPEQTETDTGERDVDEPAAEAAGTWRTGWIAAQQAPAGDALFDLGEDVEQGALFV